MTTDKGAIEHYTDCQLINGTPGGLCTCDFDVRMADKSITTDKGAAERVHELLNFAVPARKFLRATLASGRHQF